MRGASNVRRFEDSAAPTPASQAPTPQAPGAVDEPTADAQFKAMYLDVTETIRAERAYGVNVTRWTLIVQFGVAAFHFSNADIIGANMAAALIGVVGFAGLVTNRLVHQGLMQMRAQLAEIRRAGRLTSAVYRGQLGAHGYAGAGFLGRHGMFVVLLIATLVGIGVLQAPRVEQSLGALRNAIGAA